MVAPLANIKVLEVANWLAAPSCAALLGDMGADVIKVEPPGGDVFRHFNLRSLGYDYDFATNYAFELDNRGKRSITVALNQPGGPELVRKLASETDFFITNLIQRRRVQYGLTPDDIRAVNPRAIYVSLSGYGTEGPDVDRSGFDQAAFWARSGIMSLMGDPESSPAACRGGQGDHTTAMNMLAASLAALRMRDLTDEGQLVDVTLLGSGLWTLGGDLMAALASRVQPPRADRTAPSNPIWNSYQCSDGRWILLIMVQSDPYWPGFCEMVERREWRDDPRYSSLKARWDNSKELTALIESIFRSADYQTWAERLDQFGMIWAPVAELPEVVADPTVRALGTFERVQHPRFGGYETLTMPFNLHGAEIGVRGCAPDSGADTAAILEELGLDAEQVSDLAAQGVFG